jgi:hypothetical protein
MHLFPKIPAQYSTKSNVTGSVHLFVSLMIPSRLLASTTISLSMVAFSSTDLAPLESPSRHVPLFDLHCWLLPLNSFCFSPLAMGLGYNIVYVSITAASRVQQTSRSNLKNSDNSLDY